jgi:EAL domain-containing protein (putative c-di-GMP-specific phosphodiesterase class I)
MALAARRSEIGWVARINAAFEDDRFVLYHQNYRVLNTSSDHRRHLEVLIRMIGEHGEIIAPGLFLPAAERYNLMPKIDRWVIHAVFSHYQTLVAERGGFPLTCAINLSGASINADGFIDYIRAEAQRYAMGSASICFELTETVAVNNLQAAAEFIRACKAIGFQFALDDFGTGTSSFGYLKKLPVDFLKIDGGFVKDIESDPVDQAMTETINNIGHLMGMKTIAEYAENEAIVEKLKLMGVDYAQGYGVSLPSPLFPRSTESDNRSGEKNKPA